MRFCALKTPRYMVPACCSVCLFPASCAIVGPRRPPVSTHRRSPEVRLAACYFGHVTQQVNGQVDILSFSDKIKSLVWFVLCAVSVA